MAKTKQLISQVANVAVKKVDTKKEVRGYRRYAVKSGSRVLIVFNEYRNSEASRPAEATEDLKKIIDSACAQATKANDARVSHLNR